MGDVSYCQIPRPPLRIQEIQNGSPPKNTQCELSCLSCLVHSHMLVPAVIFSPQAPRSADPLGTAEVSAPLGKVSEWIVLAFRCTVRFLPEAALLKLCSRVNLPDPAPSCCFVTGDLGSSCVNSQVISRSLCAAVGLVLGCLLACPESWLRRLCVVGFRVILAILGAPDPCLKTTVVTVMSTELPVDTVSADDQLDALIAEHRLREQNSGTLDGSTLGTASVAQLASPCSVPRALAPPLPSGQNCLQLAPAAAQLIAGELSLNPLGVLAPASAPCSAPLPALPCPTVAASPNMSVFVQPSLGDLPCCPHVTLRLRRLQGPRCLCWTELCPINMLSRVVVVCRVPRVSLLLCMILMVP